jgi:hypothetical protein
MFLAWVVGALMMSTEVMPGRPAQRKVWSVAILGLIVLAVDIGILKLKAMTERTERRISQSTSPSVAAAAEPVQAEGNATPMISGSETKVVASHVTVANSAKLVPIVLDDPPPSAPHKQRGGIVPASVDGRIVSRHIRREDQVSLIAWLSQKPSQITLAAARGDVEAKMYAEEWKAVLGKSGWRVVGIQHAADRTLYGIAVIMHGDSVSRPGKLAVLPDEPAYFLAQAFELEGMRLNGHRDPKQRKGTLYLFMGSTHQNKRLPSVLRLGVARTGVRPGITGDPIAHPS